MNGLMHTTNALSIIRNICTRYIGAHHKLRRVVWEPITTTSTTTTVIIMVQNNTVLQRTNVAVCISQGESVIDIKCMGA